MVEKYNIDIFKGPMNIPYLVISVEHFILSLWSYDHSPELSVSTV